MSKAFVNDDAETPDEEAPLPPRPSERLPITPRGLAALRAELAELEARGASTTRRARVLEQILGGVYPQQPTCPNGKVGFGATVTIEDEDGARRTYTIVGPDEAHAEAGLLSSTSPLARALLGRAQGDVVVVKRPKGDEELTVVAVSLG